MSADQDKKRSYLYPSFLLFQAQLIICDQHGANVMLFPGLYSDFLCLLSLFNVPDSILKNASDPICFHNLDMTIFVSRDLIGFSIPIAQCITAVCRSSSVSRIAKCRHVLFI
jgi:hypothetical protein